MYKVDKREIYHLDHYVVQEKTFTKVVKGNKEYITGIFWSDVADFGRNRWLAKLCCAFLNRREK